MLQKLEEMYLGILRCVVIVVAGILLVATVIYGFTSLKIIRMEPTKKEFIPQVSEKKLIKSITEKEAAVSDNTPESTSEEKKSDPNAPFYERSAVAIVAFVNKNTTSTESVTKENATEITKQKADAHDDPKLVAAFAKNFADSIEKTLADPVVINAAKTSPTIDIVNKALNAFTEDFAKQIEKDNIEINKKQNEYLMKKTEGMKSLYIAGIALGTFLMIIFLSLIIKIERNLRHLANKPSVAS